MLIHFFATPKTSARTFDLKVTVLLLHGTAILSTTAYDKRSIFSVKQLIIKSGKWEKLFLKLGLFWR